MSMESRQTLTEVLNDTADDTHSVTHIESQQNETKVTYQSMHARALGLLGVFQDRGVRAGDQLVVLLADNGRFIEAFWACILGGIIPVPIAGGISDEHRRKLFRIYDKLESAFLYTNTAALDRLEQFANANDLRRHYSDLKQKTFLLEEVDNASISGKIHAARPGDVAFIQFSSGSTSVPKGVVLTHLNLLTNINAIMLGMRMEAHDTMMSWMPLTHDMGLIGFHLTPVLGRIDHVLMPTDVFVRRPALWLSKADAHRANILCSPNFGYQHFLKAFKPDRFGKLDLAHVRLIFNGAEPISAALCGQFMDTLAPYGLKPEAMFPVYGLAEATLAVSFPALDEPYEALRLDRTALGVGDAIQLVDHDNDNGVTFVNVGEPIKDCAVMISDASGAPLPDSTIGHVRIQGDNVTSGYYREDALNQSVISKEGWLDTGDLGFLREGAVFITGRAKDIIFVNGQNLYPHDLEDMAVRARAAEPGKIVVSSAGAGNSQTERLLVFVQYRDKIEEFADISTRIKKVINAAAGVQVDHVIPVSRIPKTTSGKVQRYLLAESFARGEYDEAVSFLSRETGTPAGDETPVSDVADRLKTICDGEVEGTTLGLNDNLFEIGISSLTLAQIHERIEETWPGQLDITDLFDYPTIGELAQLLETKLQSS
ncbi:MAG: non-ribosomal peptide synthetase [Gammaproteobacteria bacterium]